MGNQIIHMPNVTGAFMKRQWIALRPTQRILLGVLVVACLFWLVALIQMAWQPIVADDELVYNSAVHWPDVPMRVNPPAYMSAVRLSFSIFGESVSSARLPGIAAGFASLFLIAAIVVRALNHTDNSYLAAALAVGLYALYPQAIQNMMFIDIDTAFLTATLLGLVWVWLFIENRSRRVRVLVIALAFTLSLWVKLLSPFLTMGAIGLYLLLQGKWARVLEVMVATIIGFGVFLVTIQSNVTSQYLFGYTGGYMSRLNILEPENVRFILTVFPQAAGVVLLWFSIPMMILVVIAVLLSVKRWFSRQAMKADFFLLYGALSTVAYSMVILPAWGYPRYQAPFIPMLVLVAAMVVAPVLPKLNRASWGLVGIMAVICLIYNMVLVGDPMLRLYLLTYETTTEQVGTRLSEGLIAFTRLLIPVVAAIVIGFVMAPRVRAKRADILLVMLCAIAMGTYLTTSVTQFEARYSTRYRYGLNLDDMLTASQRIHDAVAPDGFVAAIDDVLFYTKRPGKGIYGLSTRENLMGGKTMTLAELLRVQHVDALAWTAKDAFRGSEMLNSSGVQHILDTCYDKEQYGKFVVYLNKQQTPCP